MRICYAECPYNCVDDDLGWSNTIDMFCDHPNNKYSECYFYSYELFCVMTFESPNEYIDFIQKKISCPFVKQKYANSDLSKYYPGEKVIINDKGDWVYELDEI